MQVEVKQSTDRSWYWTAIVSGKITAGAKGYNDAYGAKRAFVGFVVQGWQAVFKSKATPAERARIKEALWKDITVVKP